MTDKPSNVISLNGRPVEVVDGEAREKIAPNTDMQFLAEWFKANVDLGNFRGAAIAVYSNKIDEQNRPIILQYNLPDTLDGDVGLMMLIGAGLLTAGLKRAAA